MALRVVRNVPWKPGPHHGFRRILPAENSISKDNVGTAKRPSKTSPVTTNRKFLQQIQTMLFQTHEAYMGYRVSLARGKLPYQK